MMRLALLFLLCTALVAAARAAHGIDPNQLDDFEDGTTMGWMHGNPASPNPPVNVASGGPAGAGDNYLEVQSSGQFGAGSRMVALNTSQWSGDYNLAGVLAVALDMANFGATGLQVRIGVEKSGAPSGRFVSTIAVPLAADGQWSAVTFNLTAAEMTSVGGTLTLDQVLVGVTQLRVVSAGAPAWQGDAIAATLGLDNVAVQTVSETRHVTASRLRILHAVPNPFNPATRISYVVPVASRVHVTIHDVHGRLLEHLFTGYQEAGSHSVGWDGRLPSGRQASGGMYFVRVDNGSNAVSQKITLVQ